MITCYILTWPCLKLFAHEPINPENYPHFIRVNRGTQKLGRELKQSGFRHQVPNRYRKLLSEGMVQSIIQHGRSSKPPLPLLNRVAWIQSIHLPEPLVKGQVLLVHGEDEGCWRKLAQKRAHAQANSHPNDSEQGGGSREGRCGVTAPGTGCGLLEAKSPASRFLPCAHALPGAQGAVSAPRTWVTW